MAQLTVQVNAKPYIVGCEDGDEPRLKGLAADLDAKVREAAAAAGQVGETRVMLLGALMLADELAEAKARLAVLEERLAALAADQGALEAQAVAALDAASRRLETLATG